MDQWPVLLRLIEAIELEGLRKLALFDNANQAYENRGYVNGVKTVLLALKSLGGNVNAVSTNLDVKYLREMLNDDNQSRIAERTEQNSGPVY